jgi:DNA-directed RNA polymerase specialized sigma24 family protein
MTSPYIQKFALFFLFAFLDERLAMEVADRAITSYRSKTKNLEPASSQANQVLVRICFDLWKTNKKRIARGQPSSQLSDFGDLPDGLDQAAWLRFHKEAGDEELLALLFQKILSLPESDISEALKVSTGTLRHRMSRGLRMLGDYVGPSV